jgi:hypothetical protein
LNIVTAISKFTERSPGQGPETNRKSSALSRRAGYGLQPNLPPSE